MMDPIYATFKDYQAQHETILPLKVKEGFTFLQVESHRAVTMIHQTVEIPEITVKAMQLSLAILSFFSFLQPLLEGPRQFCKDVKNIINFAKGLKSLEGLLHVVASGKLIILNLCGLTLWIVTSLNLMERFKLSDMTAIQVYLTAIPVFGVLPYGGLVSFSVVGIVSINTLFNLEKKKVLESEESYIKSEKLVFWSKPLALAAVQGRQMKYQDKILKLKEEVNAYERLIQEGMQSEHKLSQCSKQRSTLIACQKALEELNKILAKGKVYLEKNEKKCCQWEMLEKNWRQIHSSELEDFRRAKQKKWKAKLNKIKQEKRMNLLSLVNAMTVISRQALVIVGLACGYGIIVLPVIINAGLDVSLAGCGIANFWMKRSIKKMNIPSVDLEQYFHLNESCK